MARPLAEEARRSLKPGGYLLLELAPENVHLLARELREKGWKEVAVLPDLAGRDRYLRARRPPRRRKARRGGSTVHTSRKATTPTRTTPDRPRRRRRPWARSVSVGKRAYSGARPPPEGASGPVPPPPGGRPGPGAPPC